MSSCQNKSESAKEKAIISLVERDSTINSIKLKYKGYYKFNENLDSMIIQTEEYIVDDKLAFRIDFSKYGTTWQNLEIKNLTMLETIYPTYKNRLGFDLFMSNCSSCHKSYPSVSDKTICKLFNHVKSTGKLNSFLQEGVLIDSTNTMSHPSFEFLDTLELNQIRKFLDKSCYANGGIVY